MKEEKTKPTKKKLLIYYLILAVCLLAIAAVTVGVVFAVKNSNAGELTVDGGQDDPDGTTGGETDDGTGGADSTNSGDDTDNGDGDDDDADAGDDNSANASSSYLFTMPVSEVNLTQSYVFAYDATLDKYRLHQGVDFTCAAGTEVYAAMDGTVTGVYTDDYLYGGYIVIEHADGVTTVYKFVDPVEGLTAGDTVTGGQVIATVAAATGVENAVGDHLHFEVLKNGVMEDPDDYLNLIGK